MPLISPPRECVVSLVHFDCKVHELSYCYCTDGALLCLPPGDALALSKSVLQLKAASLWTFKVMQLTPLWRTLSAAGLIDVVVAVKAGRPQPAEVLVLCVVGEHPLLARVDGECACAKHRIERRRRE